MFTAAYNKGFIFGIGAGALISLWWYNRCAMLAPMTSPSFCFSHATLFMASARRPSTYERVKAEVDKIKGASSH